MTFFLSLTSRIFLRISLTSHIISPVSCLNSTPPLSSCMSSLVSVFFHRSLISLLLFELVSVFLFMSCPPLPSRLCSSPCLSFTFLFLVFGFVRCVFSSMFSFCRFCSVFLLFPFFFWFRVYFLSLSFSLLSCSVLFSPFISCHILPCFSCFFVLFFLVLVSCSCCCSFPFVSCPFIALPLLSVPFVFPSPFLASCATWCCPSLPQPKRSPARRPQYSCILHVSFIYSHICICLCIVDLSDELFRPSSPFISNSVTSRLSSFASTRSQFPLRTALLFLLSTSCCLFSLLPAPSCLPPELRICCLCGWK